MANRLDSQSRGVINFRPTIQYVEPPQLRVKPAPIQALPEQLEQVLVERKEIEALAQAVDILAAVLQERIDDKCASMKIRLDADTDAAVIDALQRIFPDSDGQYITYQQYKSVRKDLMENSVAVGQQPVIKDEDIANAYKNMQRGIMSIGGLGTVEAAVGGLSADLDKAAQVIQPINMTQIKDEILKILANALWKLFFKKPLEAIPGAGSVLPDDLPGVKISNDAKAMLKHIKVLGL